MRKLEVKTLKLVRLLFHVLQQTAFVVGIPIPYIDFDYKRTPIKDNHVRTITVSGPTECLNKCLERLGKLQISLSSAETLLCKTQECLALNYNPNTDTDNCELLKTVQGVSIEDESQTVLLRFSRKFIVQKKQGY